MTDRTDMIDALERWLPSPFYSFHGGPLDGHEHPVQFARTDYGMIPPEMWKVGQLPPGTFAPDAPERANDALFCIHTYRFERSAGINQGRYVYVDETRIHPDYAIESGALNDVINRVPPVPWWQVVGVFGGVAVCVALLTAFVAAMAR